MSATDPPRVLVLLAAHNGTAYLPQQLASITAQREVRVDVLVSVDASSDGTEGLVDEYASKDPAIRTLAHGQHFGGAARNFYRLIAEADTAGYTHVALSDQDDFWLRDKLTRACAALASHRADGYSSNVTRWSAGRQELLDKAQPQTRWDHLFSSAGPGCTYVFEVAALNEFAAWLRDDFEAAQGVEYHDWLLYAWMRAHGYTWFIDPAPTMLYRQHGSNQLGANVGARAAFRRAGDLWRSWYADQVIEIAGCVGAEGCAPIVLLTKGSPMDLLHLALHAPRLRRSRRDALAVGLVFAAKGLTAGVRR